MFGKLVMSSFVKTEEKKLFNTSAFSSSVFVKELSGFIKLATPVERLSKLLTYFQKGFEL